MTSSTSQYISVRETAQLLGISERKVMDLIETRKLTAYKIANQFLRFKKSDVLEIKNSGQVAVETVRHPYTPNERFHDFFRYNDFYLISIIIVVVLLFVIITT